MSARLRMGLRQDVRLEGGGEQPLRLVSTEGELTLKTNSWPWLECLQRGSSTYQQLAACVQPADPAALAQFQHTFDQFDRFGLIARTLYSASGPFATFEYHKPQEGPEGPYGLSRFACMRHDGRSLVLETAHAPGRVILHDPLACQVIGQLATPRNASDFATDELGLDFVLMLAAGGFLSDRDDPVPKSWQFHDLFFHTRIRRGRSGKIGSKGKSGQILGRKKPMSDGRIELPRPDLECGTDQRFFEVVEKRTSQRSYSREPLAIEQLGEFLYRTARVRGEGRPYPSGGAIYELEIYLLVENVQGLAFGLYQYDPYEHQLFLLPDQSSERESLFEEARMGARLAPSSRPACLIVLACRHEALAENYQGIAYALTLKNAGVLLQTMCLSATALGLAACPVGTGNSDRFARLTGLNYYQETSVAELLLGLPA